MVVQLVAHTRLGCLLHGFAEQKQYDFLTGDTAGMRELVLR